MASISTEIEELKQKQNSLHLWAQQRGLTEKVNSITTSLQRTQSKSTEAGDLLRFLTARGEA